MIDQLDLLPFPRPVEQIHQLELTSFCNLRCPYCPSRDIVDKKYPRRLPTHMARETLDAALKHAKYYCDRGTQRNEINVAGIGESTMHPQFVDFLHVIREGLPQLPIVFATNGLLLTDDLAKEIAAVGNIHCWVSLHRPEKAALAVEAAKRAGILRGVSSDPVLNSDDWAGQVKWHRTYTDPIPCNWIRQGWAMVTAHGDITACCLDASGAGKIGHVNDPVGSLMTKPYELCKGCQQTINVRGWDQKEGRAQ